MKGTRTSCACERSTICYWDICFDELFWLWSAQFRGEAQSSVILWTLTLIVGILVVLALGRPFWQPAS